MPSRLIAATAALAGALCAASAASAVSFTLTGGSDYTLPGDFDPAPAPAGLPAGASVVRNATLGLSEAGRVTFTYVGSEAGFTNSFWLGDSRLFDNKTAGQAPASFVLGAGALPVSFRTDSPAATAANGGTTGFYDSLAFFELGDGGIYALFNDGATGDQDYDDMLVRLDVAPVPLPAAAWLLIGGLGALGAARRRARPAPAA